MIASGLRHPVFREILCSHPGSLLTALQLLASYLIFVFIVSTTAKWGWSTEYLPHLVSYLAPNKCPIILCDIIRYDVWPKFMSLPLAPATFVLLIPPSRALSRAPWLSLPLFGFSSVFRTVVCIEQVPVKYLYWIHWMSPVLWSKVKTGWSQD